jgi:hypothetical protein
LPVFVEISVFTSLAAFPGLRLRIRPDNAGQGREMRTYSMIPVISVFKGTTAERTSNPTVFSVTIPGASASEQPAEFLHSQRILSLEGFSVFGSDANLNSPLIALADLPSPIEPFPLQRQFAHSGWFLSSPFKILHGNARERVKSLPRVDCVVTSPPYFEQRKYGDSRNELGRENTVECYIGSLVEVFASIPLQPWASVWVNIGDKRAKDGGLLNIPKRFVLAMEAAGFRLVDEVIWVKEVAQVQGPPLGHGMIEPAPGRLNGNGHEPLYRFVRSKKDAWTDTCAVRVQRRNVEGMRYLPESLMECDTSVARTQGPDQAEPLRSVSTCSG